ATGCDRLKSTTEFDTSMSAGAFWTCALCFAAWRCASANGIAQIATSESRINALRRICALMEGVCFFISCPQMRFRIAECHDAALQHRYRVVLPWGSHSDKFPGGAPLLIELPKRRQHFFLKFFIIIISLRIKTQGKRQLRLTESALMLIQQLR